MRSKQQLLTPALFIVALALFAPVADAQTDKATMVVNDMIAALGGKAFTNVREIQANGKFFTFKRDQMAGTEVFVDYIKFPDKERTEFGTYKIKPTNINNGDAGWSVYDKKVELQTPAEVKAFQTGVKTGFQFLARFILNREGLTLQHVGTEMIDFKRNDVIEFRDSGNFFRLFVNQQSHLPTKMQVRRSGETFMREEHLQTGMNSREYRRRCTLFISVTAKGHPKFDSTISATIRDWLIACLLHQPPGRALNIKCIQQQLSAFVAKTRLHLPETVR